MRHQGLSRLFLQGPIEKYGQVLEDSQARRDAISAVPLFSRYRHVDLRSVASASDYRGRRSQGARIGAALWMGRQVSKVPVSQASGIERAVEHLIRNGEFAPLGDANKLYSVILSEPEINAIHAAFGFMQGAAGVPLFAAFCAHYGPTMKRLSERLLVFDDGNAPRREVV
jgi:hypothetical protein